MTMACRIEAEKNPIDQTQPPRYEMSALITSALLLAFLLVTSSGSEKSASPTPLTFDGSSTALKATEVVPTLETPIPQGKSAIWCASFQSAWKALEELAGETDFLSEKAEGAEHLTD